MLTRVDSRVSPQYLQRLTAMLAHGLALLAACALVLAAPTDKTVVVAGVPAVLSTNAPSTGAKVQVAAANAISCQSGEYLVRARTFR